MLDVDDFTPVLTYLGRKFKRSSPRSVGGILYPTHGLRISIKIKRLCEVERIIIVCLEGDDVANVMLGISYPTVPVKTLKPYYGWAHLYENMIFLNATALRSVKPCLLNYVCLHEIEHIRYVDEDEDATDRRTRILAKRLKLDIDCADYADGKVRQD